MPIEFVSRRAVDLVREHVPWWPAGAERVWLGLTTTDPASGTLSEPDWPGYARQEISAAYVVQRRGGGCRFWHNASEADVTIHGWFATDDAGRVLYLARMREYVVCAAEGVELCFVSLRYNQGSAVPLDALRETRRGGKGMG